MDPQDRVRYTVDFTDWLSPNTTIDSYTIEATPTGLTIEDGGSTPTSVYVWVSTPAAGVTYTVTVHAVCSNTEEKEQSFFVFGQNSSASQTGIPNAAIAPDSGLLSLEEWRDEIGYNPLSFYQLANQNFPVSSSCNAVVRERSFMDSDMAGRADIRFAILSAEEKIRNHLHYSIAPHYVEETVDFPRFPDRRFDYYGYCGPDGRWRSVQLKEGYIQDIGVEVKTLIDTANVVYTDTDGDGFRETFTIIVNTDVTSPDEIAVYFSENDRPEFTPAEEAYRIRPVKVMISSGQAVIRGPAYLLVRPILYQGFSKKDNPAIDPALPTNFVSSLEVYRRYTSAGTTLDTAQAVFIWETRPYPPWAFSWTAPTNSTDPAAVAYALGRVGLRNARLGIVSVGEAVYDPQTGEWNASYAHNIWHRPPDRVKIRYCAGLPMQDGKIDPKIRRIITRFAAAELSRNISACDNANREIYDAQFDLSRAGGKMEEQYSVTDAILNCPFGRKRGQVEAWKFVQRNQRVTGVSF